MVAQRVSLAYRPPYDWDAVMGFLAARATPGVEAVTTAGYRRTIEIDGRSGTLAVSRSSRESALDVAVTLPLVGAQPAMVERVRRLFDLDADPAVITRCLGSDPLLGGILEQHPGIRCPGAWNGFEMSVRASLGQQVSVAAATTIAGRLARRFGTPVDDGGGLARLFPSPAQLAGASIEEVGVIRTRAECIRRLARAVGDGSIAFSVSVEPGRLIADLLALPGIGPWTAQYIAMRVLGDADAFLTGDLVLRQMAGGCTARELEQRSEAWRPWRSYAVMVLWQGAKERPPKPRSGK